MSSKAIKFTYQGFTITSEIITKLIAQYNSRDQKETFGKQSIKKLNSKGKPIDSIPVSDLELKALGKELKKFGVDYAVRKRVSEKGIYDIYFKGSDVVQIRAGLRDYSSKVQNQGFKPQRPSIKERMKAAVEKAKSQKINTRQHDKNFDRGER